MSGQLVIVRSESYFLRMFRKRRFVYLADGLTDARAVVIRKGLNTIPEIHSVSITPSRSTIEVEARRDVADQVRVACDVAGATFRTRVAA